MPAIRKEFVPRHVGALDPFRASHADAAWHRHMPAIGRLPYQWAQDLRGLFEEPGVTRSVYVVSSYSTPVAWFTDDHGWVMPAVKYSNTTTTVQNRVKQGIVDHHMHALSSIRTQPRVLEVAS